MSARGTIWRWAVVLVPGALLYFLPVPAFSPMQRHLLAVFVATIIALVAQPVPMGVAALAAMSLLAVTRTLEPARVLAGFGDTTVWLVFSAFLLALAVTVTGLGSRIAYLCIQWFGRGPLSLGYSIAAAGLTLSPFVPSDTGRGGGILFPITRGIAQAMESEPGPTSGRIGRFLILVGFHANYTASAMFLTAMAANPLIATFALQTAGVELTWGQWALGASVPGLLTLALAPLLIRAMHPPEIVDVAPARLLAAAQLAARGAMTRGERLLGLVLLGVMAAWVTQPWHGLHPTIVALCGVSALLILRVMSWNDLLNETRAWDALVWFASLVMMASELNKAGVIGILSKTLFGELSGLPWIATLLVLAVGYFYIHYAFASLTAHVTALYPAFLAAAVAGGVPPLLAAMPLAYFSSLNAGLTHYSTGSAPVFFAGGYVSQGDWWRTGFAVSAMNMVIWLGVGMLWWKVLGWW
jgi:DASS family divalent anion:Na+ symporter